jgi:hypothetical protein
MSANARVSSSNVKKKQVQLPDVTGLTVAVESPAKGQSYQPFEDTANGREDEEGHGLPFLISLPPLFLNPFSPFAASHESPSKENSSSRCGKSHLQETHEGA